MGAVLLPDSTIQFTEPDVLFERSRTSIRPAFKEILDDFFPRYVDVLSSASFREEIDEIRIEGHTSSIWRKTSSFEESYLENAKLSQGRSYSVLNYVFQMPKIEVERTWLSTVLRANGLSFAKLVKDENGNEDYERSRRVEFRIATKAEEKIYTILQEVK